MPTRMFIEDEKGNYTMAEEDQVLASAADILKSKINSNAVLTNPSEVREYLRLALGSLEHEVFTCLFLDNRHRLIRFDEMFRGTVNGASVFPREVVKAALNCNASAVIFAHNHPSGNAEPSESDRRLTERLKDALNLVDVRVLDHIIVGNPDCVSFAERGLI